MRSKADPPDTSKIPADDAVGVTVVLITASYREQEFVRVGYYVTNEYEDMELRENPPAEPQFNKLIRAIAANEPRVTKFKINWDSSAAVAAAALAAANSETAGIEGAVDASAMNQEMASSMEVNQTNNASNNTVFQEANNSNSALVNPVTIVPQANKIENKENILLMQQKSFSNDSKLADANANQFVENSYDSIMS